MFFSIWLVGWVPYARIVRGEVLVAKRQEYVLAARALGFKTPRIMLGHLLPNVLTPAIVFSMLDAVNNVGLEQPSDFWASVCRTRRPNGAR